MQSGLHNPNQPLPPLKASSFSLFQLVSYCFGKYNSESMCYSDYVLWTTPETFGRWSAPQRKCFSNVLGGQVEKRVFTCFFDCNYGLQTSFSFLPPINRLQKFAISHTLFPSSSSSPLLQRCVSIVDLS